MIKFPRASAFEYALELAKILAAKPTENTSLYSDHAENVAEFIKTLTDKLSEIEIG